MPSEVDYASFLLHETMGKQKIKSEKPTQTKCPAKWEDSPHPYFYLLS